MYYKYDKEKSDKIKEINKNITETQKQIFDTLLKISKSFSDEKITKKERNESFKEVDNLKNKIKEYNKELKKISVIDNINDDKLLKDFNNGKEDKENEKNKVNEEIESTITELEDTLKQLDKNKNVSKVKYENTGITEDTKTSGRKKARTQLVVVEEDDSLSGKIKGFFTKLKSMINK